MFLLSALTDRYTLETFRWTIALPWQRKWTEITWLSSRYWLRFSLSTTCNETQPARKKNTNQIKHVHRPTYPRKYVRFIAPSFHYAPSISVAPSSSLSFSIMGFWVLSLRECPRLELEEILTFMLLNIERQNNRHIFDLIQGIKNA